MKTISEIDKMVSALAPEIKSSDRAFLIGAIKELEIDAYTEGRIEAQEQALKIVQEVYHEAAS